MSEFWNQLPVLVTGAAGLIGSHVVAALLARGAHVTAAVSRSPGIRPHGQETPSGHLRVEVADLLDRSVCDHLTDGQEVVLHFAALDGNSAYKATHSTVISHTNKMLTVNMLRACMRHSVSRVLLTSSVEVYDPSLIGLVNERAPLRIAQTPRDGYAWSKHFAEVLGEIAHRKSGLHVVIVRCGAVYGEFDRISQDRARVIPTFIRQARAGLPLIVLGDGRHRIAFLHAEDLTPALLDLVELDPGCEPVNLAGSQYIELGNLASTVIRLAHSGSPIYHDMTGPVPNLAQVIDVTRARHLINFRERLTLEEGLLRLVSNSG